MKPRSEAERLEWQAKDRRRREARREAADHLEELAR